MAMALSRWPGACLWLALALGAPYADTAEGMIWIGRRLAYLGHRWITLRRFEDAASNKPRSCMLFDIVTRKNAALPIFTVPRCAAPGIKSGTLAIDAASSHAVDSTSAAGATAASARREANSTRPRAAMSRTTTSRLARGCST